MSTVTMSVPAAAPEAATEKRLGRLRAWNVAVGWRWMFFAGVAPAALFGIGWGVVRRPEGVTAMLSPGTFGHGGAFGTQGWIDPQQKAFFILLIQRVGLPNGDNSEIRKAFQEAAVATLIDDSLLFISSCSRIGRPVSPILTAGY